MSTDRRPTRIFLAEDHLPDVTLIKEALRHAGIIFEIDHVEDGALAIQALLAMDASKLPDLIIVDLNLPKKTGFDVLAALPRNPLLEKLPVIVLTSSSSDLDRRRADDLGVTAFLSKPPDLHEFFERVGGAVRNILARKESAGGWHAHSSRLSGRPFFATIESRGGGRKRRNTGWQI